MMKVGILGTGNLLLGDEGFGVHCVERLLKRYEIPDEITVLDGGTAGIMLAPFMESVRILYVFDCVNSNERPGTLHCFSESDLTSQALHTSMSPHQLGLMEVLELCRIRGKAPHDLTVIAVVPEHLETGIGLSETVKPAVDGAISILQRRLQEHGISLKEKEPISA